MQKDIAEFLSCRSIALLGASQSGGKIGNDIADDLESKGYQVRLVHPTAAEIEGRACSADLEQLRGQVQGVVFCIPPERSLAALRQAAQAGIRRYWFQEGSFSPEVLSLAYTLGQTVVAGRCIMVYASPQPKLQD